MLRFGQTIPKGLMLEFVSWENDGDDYGSKFVYGVTEDELAIYKEIGKLIDINSDMANEDYSSELLWTVSGALQGFNKQKVYDVLGFDILTVSELEEMNSDELDKLDEKLFKFFVGKMLGYAVQYDYKHIRVLEKINVYKFENDVIIPVPSSTDSVEFEYKNK